MCDAELFNVLVGRVVRESREGISRGFSQSGPAEHCGDPLSTGKGHGNHPLTLRIRFRGFLAPGAFPIHWNRGSERKLPVRRRMARPEDVRLCVFAGTLEVWS